MVENVIPTQEIIAEVNRICEDPDFKSKVLLQKFLRFIVKEKLAGRNDDINGYSIGIHVFDKDDHFDSEQDSLVRIHAGRLRRQMKLYYLERGKNDPIVITIPKGGYHPNFVRNKQPKGPHGVSNNKSDQAPIEARLAVLPFVNLTGDPNMQYLGFGFSEDLSVELTRYNVLHVINCWKRPDDMNPENHLTDNVKARFILDGSIQMVDSILMILVKLIDTKDQRQLWATRFHKKQEDLDLFSMEKEISENVASVIGSETGLIMNKLYKEIKHEPTGDPDVLRAILYFYYYEAHISAESTSTTFQYLQRASEKNPDSLLIMSMLGCMYGNFYMLDYGIEEDSLSRMWDLTKNAYEQEPDNQLIRIIFLGSCFMKNDLSRFKEVIDTCLENEPKSPFRLGTIGFYMCLSGNWNEGKVILDKVMNSGMGYSLFLHGATCLFYYRQGEFNDALTEAVKYKIPGLFWGPLLRASCYGQLGQFDKGREEVESLLRLKPDFPEKAHVLIQRFIRDETLYLRILEGLKLAGIK
jgi:TolB-like protein